MTRWAVVAILCSLPGIVAAAEADPALVGHGGELYGRFCSTCHGEELQNNTGVSYDLRRLHAREHDRFTNSVRRGKQAMPAWGGRLDDAQIEALWAYVRANAYDAGS